MLFGGQGVAPHVSLVPPHHLQAKRKEKHSKAWEERKAAQQEAQDKASQKWVAAREWHCGCCSLGFEAERDA